MTPTHSVPQHTRSTVGTVIVLGVLVLSVIAGAWQDFTLGWTTHEAEAGYFLRAGLRLLQGQVPGVDFVYAWSPCTAAFMAASFRLFGVNLWAAKLPLALFVAAIIPLTYLWVRPTTSRAGAVAAAVVVWSLAPLELRLPYPTMFTIAPALFVFVQLTRLTPQRLIGPAWWAGLGVGVAIAIKHNIGILVGIAVWVHVLCTLPFPTRADHRTRFAIARAGPAVRVCALAVVAAALVLLQSKFIVPLQTTLTVLGPAAVLTTAGTVHAIMRDRRSTGALDVRTLLGACLAIVVGVAMPVLPMLLWLRQHGALDAFLEFGLIHRSGGGQDWGALYGLLIRPLPAAPVTGLFAAAAVCCAVALAARHPARRLAATGGAVVAVLLMFGVDGLLAGQRAASFAPLALFGAPLLLWRPTAEQTRIFTMLTAAAWFFVLNYPAAHPHSLALALMPALALGTAAVWQMHPGRWPVHRVAVGALVAAVVLQGWIEWGTVFVRGDSRGWHPVPLARVAGPHGGTWTDAGTAARYTEMAQALDRIAAPDAPLLAWPSLGLLNFVTARPNPTGVDFFWPGLMTPERAAETLERLRAAPPPVAVVRMSDDRIFGIRGYFRDLHPALNDFLDSQYTHVGDLGDWGLFVHTPTQ